MTAPDPAILAAAITRMEAEIALFPESEFPVEHEHTRAVVAALRANVAMRNALEKAERSLVTACRAGLADGDFDEQEIADMVNANPTIIAVRAALNPAGPA